jgi:hypothetical protein
VTNRLIEFFAGTVPGDEFTYEEITRAAGCTRDAWKGVIGTVRKVLLERYHIKIRTVTGIGFRHCLDNDVVDDAKARGTRAHRQFAKGAREYRDGVKDHSKLTADQQRVGIMVNTMASLTSPKANRVLAAARVTNDRLDAGGFLELMRRKLTEGTED